MNSAISQMLARYNCRDVNDYSNAMKEIFQEIILLGLSRSDFFEHAAFYGGTALRILHGLDRFSEDLDFTLTRPNSDFTLKTYFGILEKELSAFGFEVQIETAEKLKFSPIESAFIKGGTKIHFLKVGVPDSIAQKVQTSQTLKIKFEIDTDPPGLEKTERKLHMQPIPFPITALTLPCLFAGKIHALLFRNWKNRVKGRDWYDWVWYMSKGVTVDLHYLRGKIRQSEGQDLGPDEIRKQLSKKIDDLNLEQAKKDVTPFIKDLRPIDFWTYEYFQLLAERIVFV